MKARADPFLAKRRHVGARKWKRCVGRRAGAQGQGSFSADASVGGAPSPPAGRPPSRPAARWTIRSRVGRVLDFAHSSVLGGRCGASARRPNWQSKVQRSLRRAAKPGDTSHHSLNGADCERIASVAISQRASATVGTMAASKASRCVGLQPRTQRPP